MRKWSFFRQLQMKLRQLGGRNSVKEWQLGHPWSCSGDYTKWWTVQQKAWGIPNLQDVDLTWKRTDEDNGTAMLTNYLGKIGQRNVDEYVGIHRTMLVFCSFCGSYFISAHIYQREFHRSGYYHLRGSVSHLQSTQCLCFYGSVCWEYDQGVWAVVVITSSMNMGAMVVTKGNVMAGDT